MAYDPKVVLAARERLEQRRTDAANRAAALRREACERDPRLCRIEQELAATLPQITRVILEHGSAEEVEAVRAKNQALQEERAAILHRAGYDADNFEPQYTCPDCRDTGFIRGKLCDCYRRLLQEEACKQLSRVSPMRLTDFDSMDLTFYEDTVDPRLGVSPRQQMSDVIRYCREYARCFSPTAGSLLLQGATGTGKTHLSLAIAQTVIRQGYGVVYGPVHSLLRRVEEEHFGKTKGDSESQLTVCDLLVLDDLGMELDSPFYRSCIYNILNDRLLACRPTVLSTNLSMAALRERYGEQIISRILGGFEPLLCVGKDIRQLRRQRAMK